MSISGQLARLAQIAAFIGDQPAGHSVELHIERDVHTDVAFVVFARSYWFIPCETCGEDFTGKDAPDCCKCNYAGDLAEIEFVGEGDTLLEALDDMMRKYKEYKYDKETV